MKVSKLLDILNGVLLEKGDLSVRKAHVLAYDKDDNVLFEGETDVGDYEDSGSIMDEVTETEDLGTLED